MIIFRFFFLFWEWPLNLSNPSLTTFPPPSILKLMSKSNHGEKNIPCSCMYRALFKVNIQQCRPSPPAKFLLNMHHRLWEKGVWQAAREKWVTLHVKTINTFIAFSEIVTLPLLLLLSNHHINWEMVIIPSTQRKYTNYAAQTGVNECWEFLTNSDGHFPFAA